MLQALLPASLLTFTVIFSYYREDLAVDEAIELGRRAIYHAAHRDAMSGGICNGTVTTHSKSV